LLHLLCFSEFICIFAAFSELAQQVRAAHAGRTSAKKICKQILFCSQLSLSFVRQKIASFGKKNMQANFVLLSTFAIFATVF